MKEDILRVTPDEIERQRAYMRRVREMNAGDKRY